MVVGMARSALLAAAVVAGALVAGCGGAAPTTTTSTTPSPAGLRIEDTAGRLGGAVTVEPGTPLRRLAPPGRPDLRERPGAPRRDGVGAGAACPAPDVAPAPANLPAVAATTLCLLNGERADRGLPALAANPQLGAAAAAYAQDLVAGSYFSHTGRDGSTLLDRIRGTGYVPADRPWRLGENLAWGTGVLAAPGAIIRAWMNSPGHRENILDPGFREIGIGIVPGNPAQAGRRRRELRHRVRRHRGRCPPPRPCPRPAGRRASTPRRKRAKRAQEHAPPPPREAARPCRAAPEGAHRHVSVDGARRLCDNPHDVRKTKGVPMESSATKARVLVVANRTAATPALLEAVRERAARGPAAFTLLVPSSAHGLHQLVDPEDQGRSEAEDVIELALPLLEEAAGAPVEPMVGVHEPLAAIQDAVNLHGFDELIISTLPTRVSKWLKLDLPHKAAGLGPARDDRHGEGGRAHRGARLIRSRTLGRDVPVLDLGAGGDRGLRARERGDRGRQARVSG